MSVDFLLGVAAVPAALLLIVVFWWFVSYVLTFIFERLPHVVTGPKRVKTIPDRARHASAVATGLYVFRAFWLSGFSVYFVVQGKGQRSVVRKIRDSVQLELTEYEGES